jgi:hypothetical protein
MGGNFSWHVAGCQTRRLVRMPFSLIRPDRACVTHGVLQQVRGQKEENQEQQH